MPAVRDLDRHLTFQPCQFASSRVRDDLNGEALRTARHRATMLKDECRSCRGETQ
jgi:hypothetical protein